MYTSFARLGLIAAGWLAASSGVWSQDRPAPDTGSVHRLEITNGPDRTVHLVGTSNTSAADRQRLRDLEKARADLAQANELQRLRSDYISNESRMEQQRFETNYRLAGTTHAFAPGIYPDMVPVVDSRILFESELGWGWGWGSGFYGLGFPGYGYGAGLAWGPSWGSGSGGSVASQFVSDSALKTDLMAGLAERATPEFAEQAQRNYAAALANARQSETIARALGKPADDVQPVAAELPREVVLRSGDKIEGNIVKRDNDWVVLDTATGRVEVRTAEVAQIRSKK
jgi:hypothetical protein